MKWEDYRKGENVDLHVTYAKVGIECPECGEITDFSNGRKASVDPVAIMEELHRRYPNGGAGNMAALQADNPDIPWKTLNNNAREYFGDSLAKHLRAEGIL